MSRSGSSDPKTAEINCEFFNGIALKQTLVYPCFKGSPFANRQKKFFCYKSPSIVKVMFAVSLDQEEIKSMYSRFAFGSVIALTGLGLAACSDQSTGFRYGEWQWDMTITNDGQDFLDQSTDCVTRSDADAGFDFFVRDFAAGYQCFTKLVEVEGNVGRIRIDNCTDKHANGVFELRRRSAKRITVEGTYDYLVGQDYVPRRITIDARHRSDTCRLELD